AGVRLRSRPLRRRPIRRPVRAHHAGVRPGRGRVVAQANGAGRRRPAVGPASLRALRNARWGIRQLKRNSVKHEVPLLSQESGPLPARVDTEPRAADVAPGDVAAIYRAHGAQVARWAARLGGPLVDAEEVTQEVFLTVQRLLPRFRGEA